MGLAVDRGAIALPSSSPSDMILIKSKSSKLISHKDKIPKNKDKRQKDKADKKSFKYPFFIYISFNICNIHITLRELREPASIISSIIINRSLFFLRNIKVYILASSITVQEVGLTSGGLHSNSGTTQGVLQKMPSD